MPKTTVHTILQEIGIRALREYIYKHLPAPDFHSHDFTRNFERHFATQYIQMQGLYARKTTIEARNTTISSEIGKFLGRNRDLLQIEKGPKRISINMNGKSLRLVYGIKFRNHETSTFTYNPNRLTVHQP